MTLAAEAAALLIIGGALPLAGVGIGWAMATARSDRRELADRAPAYQPAAAVEVYQLAPALQPGFPVAPALTGNPRLALLPAPAPLRLSGGVEVVRNSRPYSEVQL